MIPGPSQRRGDMEILQTYCAGICGEEGLFGYIFYLLLRLTADREQFRLW